MTNSDWLRWHSPLGRGRTSLGRFRPQLEILETRTLLTLVPVNPMLFGLNQPWIDGSTYLAPGTSQGAATRDAVARLGAQAQRYPGGTVAPIGTGRLRTMSPTPLVNGKDYRRGR